MRARHWTASPPALPLKSAARPRRPRVRFLNEANGPLATAVLNAVGRLWGSFRSGALARRLGDVPGLPARCPLTLLGQVTVARCPQGLPVVSSDHFLPKSVEMAMTFSPQPEPVTTANERPTAKP